MSDQNKWAEIPPQSLILIDTPKITVTQMGEYVKVTFNATHNVLNRDMDISIDQWNALKDAIIQDAYDKRLIGF